jgi:outer membrane lipoprotein-sorting protein
LIGTNEAMRYRYDGNGDHWVTQYAISRGRAVTVALDRDLHMNYVLIEDPLESVFIQYKSVDEETGYPTEITITVKSQPDYKVTIEVTEIRTGGPFNTPFSL